MAVAFPKGKFVVAHRFVEIGHRGNEARQRAEPELARLHRHKPNRRLAVSGDHHIVAGLSLGDQLRQLGLGILRAEQHDLNSVQIAR
ncbi:MAG: hypothetical protein OXF68_09965 [Gammaproteobacteria bacterium]|nr:hypothetical protein [Gammaproteobacteria bacterium]